MSGIVITGATGVVGMALIEKCIKENVSVLVFCHKTSKRKHVLPQNSLVEIREIDLDELDLVEGSEKKYDVFYHLGWMGTFGPERNNFDMQLDNVQCTLKAVELAKRLGCHTFVGVGSQAEYGPTNDILRPNTTPHPETGYGIAKLCAGHMSRKLCEKLGVKHIWMRILSVYGPYDRAETMAQSTIRKMLKGEDILLTPGEQIWDYLFSEDTAEALWLVGKYGKDKAIYCLGSGKCMPLKDYVSIIARETDTKSEIKLGAIPYPQNQVMMLCADIEDIKRDTGFSPRTDFSEGVRKTIDWIKKQDEKEN